MFVPGEKVLYGIHGVCVVIGFEDRIVDRTKRSYLVLEPLEQIGTRFLVPVDNEKALWKVKKLLSKEELLLLLKNENIKKEAWIEEESARKQRYRDLISNADHIELLAMIRALYKHKQVQDLAGRKLHQCDETFLKEAQNLLESEFSAVLEIPKAKVRDYIVNNFLDIASNE